MKEVLDFPTSSVHYIHKYVNLCLSLNQMARKEGTVLIVDDNDEIQMIYCLMSDCFLQGLLLQEAMYV